jgi:methylated-DNA-protein-cysteine methyltransferase-like protein
MLVKKSYFKKVFEVTQMIPEGRVSTYGMIADYLALGSARMVGWALNHSHSEEEFIPAHRVVNRKGELSGRAHFKPPSLMQELLEAEGVKIIDHRIIDFEKLKWHPEESVI